MSMTNSERRVLKKIREHGRVLSTDLPDLVRLASRTVNFAIRKLIQKGLIRKTPNLKDMRTMWYYPVNEEPTATDGHNKTVVLTQAVTG